MNVLVDTHILLWASAKTGALPAKADRVLSDPRNSLWFSVVSIWEVAIKRSLEKPDFRIDAGPLRAGLLRNDFVELPVEGRHILPLAAMPFWHNDPFDRLLVAQAIAEGMILLTANHDLEQYGSSVHYTG